MATPIPPTIPGDLALRTLELETLKVENDVIVEGNLIVDGDITCDSLTATTTVAAGTTVTAGTSMSAGTTVTAGTGFTATTGNITATTGTLRLTNAKSGTSTLVLGTVTVNTNVVLATGDRIFLNRRTTGGAAFGTPIVTINATGAAGVASFTITSKSPSDGTTTVTTDVGVFDWVVVSSSAFT